MEERLRRAVEEALRETGAEEVAYTVERPGEMAHGDYATNAALVAAKKLGQSPRAIAEALATRLKESLGDLVSGVDVAGPGFINFTLSPASVRFQVAEAAAKGDEWGKGTADEGKRVMVEYTDPNPFKEMHIGHLMSNAIGEAVVRLIRNSGAEAVSVNYQGDVGPHVAKAIWGLRKTGVAEPISAKELSEAYVVGNRAYEDNPDAKTEIDELNKAIYEGKDRELMALWQKGKEISLEAFESVYRQLGTKFDYYFFESEVAESGTRIVKDGVATGVFEESEGALIYRGEKKGLHTLVFVTSRGTPTYEAKELGLPFLKEQRWPSDESLIVTANEQVGHFKVVKAALEDIAPLLGAKTRHIPHGFLRLVTGKMSSREGTVITAESFIAEVTAKVSERSADPLIAQQVAIGAIKFMVLRQSPGQDIIFDPEKSLSLEGDSGPYLQYALVRAKKILSYAGEGGAEQPEVPYDIERIILHYPEVAARSARMLAPNLLINYLTELAGAWNAFYAQEQVLGSPEEAYKQRVARAFANTMTNGLRLLGIPAPEKM